MSHEMKETIGASLKSLMMERCGIPEEKFRPEATLQGDLELDSLDAVELAMALEDTYDIKVTDEDMIPMRTVGDVMALIERLQNGTGIGKSA
jgi:acyl carrier protein